jgi:RNA polymerase-associated protein LEO1
MLGSECFDVSIKPMGNHEHAYLLAHQTDSGALESQTEFTDHMTFRPSGLKSDTHRHLTAQIADKQVKKNKTKMYFTDKNPELVKLELESQENERLRAQKKLELQRHKADMRNMGIESSSRRNNFDDYDADDYPTRQTQDRYDDDFVVDDDEYDEEEDISRDNRLDNLKNAGMDRYNRARYSDEEEEEEEEDFDENMEEDEDEELVVRRTNKRHKFSSDEDED